MQVEELRPTEFEAWTARMRELQRGAWFPLGSRRLLVDNGRDWSASYRRLGEPVVYIAREGEEMLGAVVLVLRQVPVPGAMATTPAWFAAWVKIRRIARHRQVALRLALRILPRRYFQCRRGFGLRVDPIEGADPTSDSRASTKPSEGAASSRRIQGVLSRLPRLSVSSASRLSVFGLESESMRRFLPTLQALRGPVGFLSLDGQKELLAPDAPEPLPLLHAQFGPSAADASGQPREGFLHMFCAPEGDPLELEARKNGLEPVARVTIYAHRMPDWDWSFLLTSDF